MNYLIVLLGTLSIILFYKITLNCNRPNRYDLIHTLLYATLIHGIIYFNPTLTIIEPLGGLLLLASLMIRYLNTAHITNLIISAGMTLINITISDAVACTLLFTIVGKTVPTETLRQSPFLYSILLLFLLIIGLSLAYVSYRIKDASIRYLQTQRIEQLPIIIIIAFATIGLLFYWMTYNVNMSTIKSTQLFITVMLIVCTMMILYIFMYAKQKIG